MLQGGVPVEHGLRGTCMDLEGNLAGSLSLRILDRCAQGPVDRRPDPIAHGENLIPIPIAMLHRLDPAIIPIQLSTTVFVIDLAP